MKTFVNIRRKNINQISQNLTIIKYCENNFYVINSTVFNVPKSDEKNKKNINVRPVDSLFRLELSNVISTI